MKHDIESKINLTALSKEQFVDIMIKAGSKSASLETLESDIASGAPINDDGTIHFLHYSAWLIRELAK